MDWGRLQGWAVLIELLLIKCCSVISYEHQNKNVTCWLKYTAGAMSSMFAMPVAALFLLGNLNLIWFLLPVPLLLALIAAVITSHFFIGTDVLFSFGPKASWHEHFFILPIFRTRNDRICLFFKMYFLITHF